MMRQKNQSADIRLRLKLIKSGSSGGISKKRSEDDAAE